MKKQRSKGLQQLAQCLTVREWRTQDSNTSQQAPETAQSTAGPFCLWLLAVSLLEQFPQVYPSELSRSLDSGNLQILVA